MALQTWSSGQVLTATSLTNLQANDYNITVNTSTGNYTLVVGDRGTRRVANSASAIAFTVNNSIFSAGDTVEIHNIGAGTLTITAGAGVTINSADVLTVAQWQGGTLYFTSASAAIWFPRAKTVGGGLTLISSTTIGSAVSSVTVSNAFSSTYDAYRVIISGGVGSSTNAQLNLTFGSTATNYEWAYLATKSTSVTGVGSTTGTFIQVGEINTNLLFSAIDIVNPNNTKYTWVSGVLGYNLVNQDSRAALNGVLKDTTAYTAFTLTTSTGTITGGTIRVYGYQNS